MSKADNFTQKLYAGITWSSLETILFQALLLVHNLLLFKQMPLETYGKVGLIFSVAYGCSYGINGGFELFYTDTPTNDNRKESLIVVQGVWIGLCIAMMVIIRHLWSSLPLLAIILAAAESLKRTGKVITFAAHRFTSVAQYELLHIMTYCITIWGLWYAGFKFNEYLLTLPVIGTTLCCTGTYFFTGTLYKKMAWPKDFWFLLKKRIILCSGTFYHVIFSGNFLTPLTYALLGPLHASAIKLASNCTHGVLAIAERIIGTSATLLCPASESPKLYHSIGKYLWYGLGSGITFAMILISYSLWTRNMLAFTPYALLYVIMHGAGLASTLCERTLFAKTPQTPYFLSSFTLVSCLILYTVGFYFKLPILALILFVGMRIAISLILGITSSRVLAPTYFARMTHNLAFLFCILILCVFFMRE